MKEHLIIEGGSLVSLTSDLKMKHQPEEMDNVALTPQEAMADTDIYIFLKMQTFTKPGGITRVANTCKSLNMHWLACFALLGLWYRKSVLMRHIYARKYKKLIFSIDQWNASKLISIMKKKPQMLQH